VLPKSQRAEVGFPVSAFPRLLFRGKNRLTCDLMPDLIAAMPVSGEKAEGTRVFASGLRAGFGLVAEPGGFR
jgi:hypothetical protein